MPDLSKLVTKAMQIDVLRTVRTQTSARYRDLKKEQEKMTVLLRSLNTIQNRGLALATNSNEISTRGQHYYQHSLSLAETTISRYSRGGNNNEDTGNASCTVPNNIETQTHPDTGLQHPYDKSRDFIIRFPIGF